MKFETRSNSGALLAFIIWGLLPIYWSSLSNISLDEIFFLRITWSLIILFIYNFTINRKNVSMILLKNKSNLFFTFMSALMLFLNWKIYIYTISLSLVVEASLGYYLNPIVLLLIGIIFNKERITKPILVISGLAFSGVLLLTLQYGRFPIYAVLLAVTFAGYGFCKRKSLSDPFVGLMIELKIMFLMALPTSCFINSFNFRFLFIEEFYLSLSTGIVTILPLMLYSKAVPKMKLSTVGLLQYVSPTLMLIVGFIFFKETLSKIHIIAIILILSSLIIFWKNEMNVRNHQRVYIRR